jgi:dihydrofolate reductase
LTRELDLQIIVAVDQSGGYANGREIPWSFEADWHHFKKQTNNSVCIMGRGTYEDIAERRRKRTPNFRVLLPNRESYVVSRTLEQPQGATVLRDVYNVAHKDNQRIFLLGGFRLWTQYWHSVNRIWMTIVPGQYETDKKFPVHWIDSHFQIIDGHKEETEQGELMFVEYKRIKNETRRNNGRKRRRNQNTGWNVRWG